MKSHINIDAASSLVHTVVGTAVNVSDVTQAPELLHRDATASLRNTIFQGIEKRPENFRKAVTWHVFIKRSKRKALHKNKLAGMTEKLERLKAIMRSKVEHPFHVKKTCLVIGRGATAAWRRTIRE